MTVRPQLNTISSGSVHIGLFQFSVQEIPRGAAQSCREGLGRLYRVRTEKTKQGIAIRKEHAAGASGAWLLAKSSLQAELVLTATSSQSKLGLE